MNLNVVDEAKLATAGEEVVDRAAADAAAVVKGILDGLDGWTLTVHFPSIAILRRTWKIPDITIRLNKPKQGEKS